MRFSTNPFEEMERLFDQTRRSMGAAPRQFGVDTSPMERQSGGIEVLSSGEANLGMEATDDGYVVTADLPGFETEDIDLRFDDGVLTIHGEYEMTDEGEGSWRRRSRRVHEQLAIPGTVLTDDIEATYRNGVLEVHLPVEEDVDEDAHRIDIE